MYELIITEKPAAAKKIAEALADGKPIKESYQGVPYYKLSRGKKDIIVASAVGHLFALAEKEKKGWQFPVFDIEWKPVSETSRDSAFTKKYFNVLKKISKDADSFIIACDYDQEGEVIGLNVVRYICKQKDAHRMKFSTLTKSDLVEAYENKSQHLDWGQAEAGETRHFLDWYNGINYSRALTSAIKSTGAFKIMSTGRVQGPALKIIVDREREIMKFKPTPFWQIELIGESNGQTIIASHKEDKFWEKDKADRVIEKTKGQKESKVDKIERREFNQMPPFPFDLTSLQIESYRCFNISPKETLEIAQGLYTSSFISYPRTSSQQLPVSIGYERILNDLTKQKQYAELGRTLLKKSKLMPNNGKKTDPAHPAIFPTGIVPRGLKEREAKIYDLIVKRFLATFAESAIRETILVYINCNEEIFVSKGKRTIEKGWLIFYAPYVNLEEIELPNIEQDSKIKIKKIELLSKETQAPKRYTPASIIKELEKRNLGTKCLTSNNFVKINSNNKIHIENIAELFDDLYSNFPIEGNGMKIAINHSKSCFSIDSSDEIKSQFILISRRKLLKDESVYRIEYKDGSFIELTEDHPVLIFDGQLTYVRVKDLKESTKSVTSVKFQEKVGAVICTWEGFLKKCTTKTKLNGVTGELSNIRKNRNVSQHALGSEYAILQSRVSVYELTQMVPLYVISKLGMAKPTYICSGNKNLKIKNPFPLRMTSSLARLLANLVGDCSIDAIKIIQENSYDFRYHNTNIDLINRFVSDIKNVFGIDAAIKLAKPKEGHLPKYYVHLPAIAGRLIFTLFPEVLKKNAVGIPPEFYTYFIGALFDDEGHAMKSEPKLFISNTNFALLENVEIMLAALGISSSLDKKQFKLYIRGRENLQKFLEIIPIHSVRKKQNLIDNLNKRYSWKGYPTIKKERDLLALLNLAETKELTLKKIAIKLRLPVPNVKETIQLLRKKGFIKQVTVGISEYPRKRITYKLIKPLEGTFYTYIDEQVVSPHFITKTIASIKKINYDSYVYDITNNPQLPNFILSNGVVVHNSTRSEIIDTLFQRGYAYGKSIEATTLGISTVETLEKYCPKIIDEELTRHFEIEMERIREKQQKKEKILEDAEDAIKKIIADFKEHQKEIGAELSKANRATQDEMAFLGICPVCKEGNLILRRGKFGSFASCNKYPDCKTIFSIPRNALIKSAKKNCEVCGFPKVLAIKKAKQPLEFCLNPKCPSKHVEGEAGKQAKAIAKGEVKRKCPKCNEGDIVLRSSIYGKFYACNRFPKCRYTEKLTNHDKNSNVSTESSS